MGNENEKTTAENIDLNELYNSQIINLIKKYENTNEMMPLASIKSDLFLARNKNDFNIFIKLITKCSKNISDEDLNYLLSLFSIKETSSKELEEILNMINNEITIRKLKNTYIESNQMNSHMNENHYNMHLDSKSFNPLISSGIENAYEKFILNNQHIELGVPGGKIIQEVEEPTEIVNLDHNIIEESEETQSIQPIINIEKKQEDNTKKVKEKELIISRIRTLKENEKKINKDILKVSARIILQNAAISILSDYTYEAFSDNKTLLIKIIRILFSISSATLIELGAVAKTGDNFIEALLELNSDIIKKLDISINKKKLKKRLASLNLDEINNDLEENKHVK